MHRFDLSNVSLHEHAVHIQFASETLQNNVKLMMVGSMMNKVTAHLDVPMEYYSHEIASMTYNPAHPSCYIGK